MGPVSELLNSSNPYHNARAIWLLAMLGEKGEAEVRKLLDHSNELFRATAFRALRQTESDVFVLAEKLSADPSSFVRREVAIALRDLPFDKTKSLIVKLAQQCDGTDKWYLETIASACLGHEEEVFREILKTSKR